MPSNVGRVCSKCGQLFPATAEYFNRVPANPIGLNTQCKNCTREANRKYQRELFASIREGELSRLTPEKRAVREREIEASREKREQRRQERISDPEAFDSQLAYNQNERAESCGAEGRITAADIRAIRKAQTDKSGRLICWRCHLPIEDVPDLDHFIPLLLGGKHIPGNLHFMHAICNRRKSWQHPHDLGMLI